MTAIWGQLVGVYAIWLREVKRSLRDKGQLIGGIQSRCIRTIIHAGLTGHHITGNRAALRKGEIRAFLP